MLTSLRAGTDCVYSDSEIARKKRLAALLQLSFHLELLKTGKLFQSVPAGLQSIAQWKTGSGYDFTAQSFARRVGATLRAG